MRASTKAIANAVNDAHIRCAAAMNNLFGIRPGIWTESENDARLLALAVILDETAEKIEKLLPTKEEP